MELDSIRFDVCLRTGSLAQFSEWGETDRNLRDGGKEHSGSPEERRQQTREARHEPHTQRMLFMFRASVRRAVNTQLTSST